MVSGTLWGFEHIIAASGMFVRWRESSRWDGGYEYLIRARPLGDNSGAAVLCCINELQVEADDQALGEAIARHTVVEPLMEMEASLA